MIPSEVNFEINDDRIRFECEGYFTDWMSKSNPFVKRIDEANLNRNCPRKHLLKEFEIKILLDEGVGYLNSKNFLKAVECFDDVLFYESQYGEALLYKSHALFGQRHYVKALRFYKRAINLSSDLRDTEYHKLLLAKSNSERDNFPPFKKNINAGDEHFSSGNYEKALESYKKALANPSKQKEKILFKLLNKTATTYLKLNDFENALDYFNESLNQLNNDYAWFGKGYCEYELGLDGAGESLRHAVEIKKDQLLEKGLILNELGLYDEAFKTFDFLLKNHFRQDDMYIKALNGRNLSMRELGIDD